MSTEKDFNTTPPASNDSELGQRPAPSRRRSSTFRATFRATLVPNPELEALQQAEFDLKPWPWSMFQGLSTDSARMTTYAGCTSSAIVLAVRLYLDITPTAYLIHSIIVFFDMILIHMFTHSLWLSVSGEVVTYVFFLSFHFTKETMWELMETTVLAILSSMYMISSRKQVMVQRDLLTDDIDSLRERGALLLRNISQVHEALQAHERKNPGSMRESVMVQMHNEQDQIKQMSQHGSLMGSVIQEEENDDDDEEEEDETVTTDVESSNPTTASSSLSKPAADTELTRHLLKSGECSCSKRTLHKRVDKWLAPFQHKKESSQNDKKCHRMKCYREMFFEYFLDGAAGVMYTSFLGLIVDAALKYGDHSY